MDDRDRLRALIDELTDEEADRALDFLRWLFEERRPPEESIEPPTADRDRPRDD